MKKFKNILSIIISCIFLILLIIGIYVGIEYYNKSQEEDRQNFINAMILAEQAVLNGTQPEAPKDNDSSDDNNLNLDDIISGSVDESKVDSVFSNITMISSSTFKATLNGEEKTYRLIGVASDGDSNQIKNILESLTGVTITQDSKKKDGDVNLVYLWSGDPKNINNMINIQIVKLGFAKTTYTDAVTYPEGINVTYSLQFIKASKT